MPPGYQTHQPTPARDEDQGPATLLIRTLRPRRSQRTRHVSARLHNGARLKAAWRMTGIIS